MFTVFLIGNIASGKSTAARYLESKGARRIDLDVLAKDLYVPGSDIVCSLAEAFGWDVLDEFGCVRTDVLAARAFVDGEHTELLNGIVHPAVKEQLAKLLLPAQCCSVMMSEVPLTVVEVSTPQGLTDMFALGDDVLAITAPLVVRRERALGRGMRLEDFEARCARQPSDEELQSMAYHVIDNEDGEDGLYAALDAWLRSAGVSFDNGPFEGSRAHCSGEGGGHGSTR